MKPDSGFVAIHGILEKKRSAPLPQTLNRSVQKCDTFRRNGAGHSQFLINFRRGGILGRSRYRLCSILGMLFSFCLVLTTAALSLGTIVAGLRRAPEAYEDEHGLQIIQAPSRQLAGLRSHSYSAKRASSHSRYWRVLKAFLHISGPAEHPRRRLSAKA